MLIVLVVMGVKAENDYCLCVKTTSGTKTNDSGETVAKDIWDDQITYTPSVSLTKGNKYTLFLKVKATEDCSIAFWPIWNASPNKNQWGGSTDVQYLKTCSVSTEWKTLRWAFTAEYDIDGFDFEFGGLNGSLYIDDVKLADNSVGVNIVTNGSFTDNSSTGWSTKTSYNGTTFEVINSGYAGGTTDTGEPIIPDTWEFAKQGNPNFQVYLAFGQSNMEGNAAVEAIDKQDVPERFKMMAAVDYSSPSRKKGQWYTAVPPLCRQGTGLTPCDYFGRTLVENLPDSVSVGVINVAVGGAKIELFMQEYKDDYIAGEATWFKNYCAQYDNDPLGRLIEMGKIAQKTGVIKGILLHQGESNNGASDWCEKVSKVYKRICYYLGLDPDNTPLLAGETLYKEMGGGCYWHNQAALPHLKEWVPNSYVISAEDLPGNGVDAWHFSAEGYRELGRRYGQQMLEILNDQATSIKVPYAPSYNNNGKRYTLDGREVKSCRPNTIIIENGIKKIAK